MATIIDIYDHASHGLHEDGAQNSSLRATKR